MTDMGEVTINFEIKWKEYYHIIAEQMRKRTAICVSIVLAFIAFISTLAIIFLGDFASREREIIGTLIAAAFLFTSLMVLFVIPRYIIDRTNFPYERTFVGSHHATVNENGLTATFEFGGNLIYWSQLGIIREGRYTFYFYTTKKQWTFIPKIDMTPEEIVEMRSIIRKYASKNSVVKLKKK
jgi:hypothetical protein